MTGVSGFLLDTNVLSEIRKKKPDAGVMAFMESVEPSDLYLSVLSVGEFHKGVAAKRREDIAAAERLSTWLAGLETGYADRILSIDPEIAKLWGEWSGERPRPVIDTLLAATAVVRQLTLVTRNVRDVEGLPVRVHNPWRG